jgi:S-adenosylmethionine:tRNA ribosyltransferase-isomerase
MNILEYDYRLPEELIAQHPAIPRDYARLMVLQEEKIIHKRFSDIAGYLRKGDVLVLNSTKVIRSKLVGKKDSGSSAEIILTDCLDKGNNIWECHIKARNPHVGTRILLGKGADATLIRQNSVDRFSVRISGKFSFDDALLPNPPYIKHDVTEEEYQTVYARECRGKGSLAAPTAGLHFTKDLLRKIKDKGVKIVFIALHVGFGTFLPIMDDIEDHKTEGEYFEISKNAAKTINNRKGRLIVVGTTTLKALESSVADGKIMPAKKVSEIFIYPGHEFSSRPDALITNFHLPKSSLLLLTCAFCGKERIMHSYKEAVEKKYRFYSLGDAMMMYRKNI